MTICIGLLIIFFCLNRNVKDIDLYVGGITEKHIPGAYLGPTFSCIVGRVFENLKKGDRFWFESDRNPAPFTTSKDIKKSIRNFK